MKYFFHSFTRTLLIAIGILVTSCAARKEVCSHSGYRIKDSVVYVYDTVYVHHYIDTVMSSTADGRHASISKKKIQLNPSNLGIGPSIGTYYSPFNGFDLLFGFGVQYYFTSLSLGRAKHHHPSFHRKGK